MENMMENLTESFTLKSDELRQEKLKIYQIEILNSGQRMVSLSFVQLRGL